MITAAIGAAFALSLVAAPGAGAVAFQEAGSFTSPNFTWPIGIATDPASGDVYVASQYGPNNYPEPGQILRFDAAGTPLSPAGMGSGYYVGVAVEQGGEHRVYGFDGQINGGEGTPFIEGFDNTGSPLGSPFPFEIGDRGALITSDAQGNIYFPDATTETVKKYTSAATAGTPAEFACTGSDCNSTPLSGPRDVAVDAAGNVYVADSGNNRVVKFNPDGTYNSVFYEGAVFAVAVDPTSETVLVSGNDGSGQHVTALDYAGNVVGEIPTTEFEGSFIVTLAVNPNTEKLYALGFGGSSAVKMFNILPAPAVTTGSASSVGAHSATLGGTVNPHGSLNEECVFEYTTDADFQANEWANAESLPCSPQPFNEETDVAVSANASGLAPETTYDYRVFDMSEAGSTAGAPVQFTTAAPAPGATTSAASAISQTAATLNGTVDAEGNSASCKFEYGTTTAYGSSVPCSVSPVTGSSATAVSAVLSGLSANTTYHFRVVAESAGGTSNGSDMSFATSADTCATNAALCPPKPKEEPHGEPPHVEPPRNENAYKVCVKKANKAYKKALAKAAHKHGKAKGKAKKSAKTKFKKAVKKCAAANS